MGASVHSTSEHNGQWPASFVVAAVCLVAASVYLCLSIAQAIQPHARRVLETASLVSSPAASVVAVGTVEGEPVSGSQAETERGPRSAALPPGSVRSVPSERLRNAIVDGAGADADHIAVSVKRLSDGATASLNGDVQFYAASTFKLAILYEAALRHSRDEISFNDRLFISEEDASEDLGTSAYLHFEDDGSITIRNLLRPMIEVSDNSSAVTLLHAFGSGSIDETLRALGMPTMTVNSLELWTTADDLARLMEAIYSGESVRPEDRDFMRELLIAQTNRNGIPLALSNSVAGGLRIGNKTGTWEGAQHDVAFIEGREGAYVISVLTDGSYEGWEAMHRVAQTVHQALNNRP